MYWALHIIIHYIYDPYENQLWREFPMTCPQDERAIRLSLLTRGNSEGHWDTLWNFANTEQGHTVLGLSCKLQAETRASIFLGEILELK